MKYTSNLNDEQWDLIKEHFDIGSYGNRRKHQPRDLVNAILYLTKTGCQWRSLPKTFPPWQAVYSLYRRHKKAGTWEAILKNACVPARNNQEVRHVQHTPS